MPIVDYHHRLLIQRVSIRSANANTVDGREVGSIAASVIILNYP